MSSSRQSAKRKAFPSATLARLRETPSAEVLFHLADYCKGDPTYRPVKDPESRRWHIRTDSGEFEILTTGVKWYDGRARTGGGGAIDLAMHILRVPFVDAVRILTARIDERG
ncbi:MAG: hypothetical protein ACREUT_12470 [Steroidobacteraceae bacterium]